MVLDDHNVVLAVFIDKIQPPTKIKKEKTNMFYTHIPLVLTWFHLYWRLAVLRDIYANTREL